MILHYGISRTRVLLINEKAFIIMLDIKKQFKKLCLLLVKPKILILNVISE